METFWISLFVVFTPIVVPPLLWVSRLLVRLWRRSFLRDLVVGIPDTVASRLDALTSRLERRNRARERSIREMIERLERTTREVERTARHSVYQQPTRQHPARQHPAGRSDVLEEYERELRGGREMRLTARSQRRPLRLDRSRPYRYRFEYDDYTVTYAPDAPFAVPNIMPRPNDPLEPIRTRTTRTTEWLRLSPEIRNRAKAIILAYYEPTVLDQIRAAYHASPAEWMSPHHMFFGMGVRNLLRTGVTPSKDTLLAGIPDSDLPSENWDDYYIAALEYAAGIRVE